MDSPENRILIITSSTLSGVQEVRYSFKPLQGRGRRREEWVEFIHEFVYKEVHILRLLGIKITSSLLRDCAIMAITDKYGKRYLDKIDFNLINRFKEQYDIVARKKCGKNSCSSECQPKKDHEVSYHLGDLKRRFELTGTLKEENIVSTDETHFFYDQDSHRLLRVKGDTNVNYLDVLSDTEGLTVVLRICGGKDAKVEEAFLF